MLAQLSDSMTKLIVEHGYLAIFVLMLLDSACIPFPSEITLLFGGALTSTAFIGAGQELSLLGVIVAAMAGTLVGSWLAYGVGYVGGRPIIDRFGRYLLIRPHEIDRAHTWFERHGEAVVLYGRLVPLVRSFVSLPAGIAAMRFRRFTVYTLIGSLVWCVALATLGACVRRPLDGGGTGAPAVRLGDGGGGGGGARGVHLPPVDPGAARVRGARRGASGPGRGGLS